MNMIHCMHARGTAVLSAVPFVYAWFDRQKRVCTFPRKRVLFLIMGVLLVMGLFGCGEKKYRLSFDDEFGFRSEKSSYAAGEQVRVVYDLIASDTDYSFRIEPEEVELHREYDGTQGYVFTFTMPAQDVFMSVESRNSMEWDPEVVEPGFTGFGPVSVSPESCITGENQVFDYYEAVVATVGGDGHDEYVLYRYTDAELVLALYSRWDEDGGEETMSYCVVPASVLDDCMALVKRYKMHKWKKGAGLRGKEYVVRFLQDGEQVRVSSDEMPERGEEAFYEIRSVLVSAWAEGRRSTAAEVWFCPECGTRNEGRYCSVCGIEKGE